MPFTVFCTVVADEAGNAGVGHYCLLDEVPEGCPAARLENLIASAPRGVAMLGSPTCRFSLWLDEAATASPLSGLTAVPTPGGAANTTNVFVKLLGLPAAGRASPGGGRASTGGTPKSSRGTPPPPSPLSRTSPLVAAALPVLEAAARELGESDRERLAGNSALLDAARSHGHLLPGDTLALVSSLGLHRLPGGVRDGYDLHVATGSDGTKLVFQRPPPEASAASAAGGGGASSPLPPVKGISSFIIASPLLFNAAHEFMAALTATKAAGDCRRLPPDSLLHAGFSIWIDRVLATADSIPVIFHATITPAAESMPVDEFLDTFFRLDKPFCCVVRPKAGADVEDEFRLPPPAPTDAVPVTPTAKPVARRAGFSDPLPVVGSAVHTPGSVPGVVSSSPFASKLLF